MAPLASWRTAFSRSLRGIRGKVKTRGTAWKPLRPATSLSPLTLREERRCFTAWPTASGCVRRPSLTSPDSRGTVPQRLTLLPWHTTTRTLSVSMLSVTSIFLLPRCDMDHYVQFDVTVFVYFSLGKREILHLQVEVVQAVKEAQELSCPPRRLDRDRQDAEGPVLLFAGDNRLDGDPHHLEPGALGPLQEAGHQGLATFNGKRAPGLLYPLLRPGHIGLQPLQVGGGPAQELKRSADLGEGITLPPLDRKS